MINFTKLPTRKCNCPDPMVEGDICVKCFGLDPIIVKKKRTKKKEVSDGKGKDV